MTDVNVDDFPDGKHEALRLPDLLRVLLNTTCFIRFHFLITFVMLILGISFLALWGS